MCLNETYNKSAHR